MLSDVRNYYGLAKDFGQAGYFETEHSEQIVREATGNQSVPAGPTDARPHPGVANRAPGGGNPALRR